jgi:hypothetical protein
MISTTFPARPVRAIEREAQHLHEVERAGESEWTPWLAILGLALSFAGVVAVLTALAVAVSSVAH